jgi:aromatic-amino-acid transaminase
MHGCACPPAPAPPSRNLHVAVFHRRTGPARPDPGLTEAFNADPNPAKVNLGVGVYFDDRASCRCCAACWPPKSSWPKRPSPSGYLPIDGIAAYDRSVQELVFGADSAAVRDGPRGHRADAGRHRRPEGRRRLPEAAEPGAKVLISDPSWENHRALFTAGRLRGRDLPLLRRGHARHPLRRHAGRAEARHAGTVVVLHACCHNPTGYDLTPAQWAQVVRCSRRAAWCPSWTWPTRASATASPRTVPPCRCSSVRAWLPRCHLVLEELLAVRRARRRPERGVQQQGRGARVLSQLKVLIRGNYSNPPTHGAQVVSTVLATPHCAPSGKANWPACASASSACARRWCNVWPRPASSRT